MRQFLWDCFGAACFAVVVGVMLALCAVACRGDDRLMKWLEYGKSNEVDVRRRIAEMPDFRYDATSPVINVPPGNWLVSAPIVLRGQVLQGSGRDISRLWVSGSGPAVHVYADSAGRRNMRAINDGLSELGTGVRMLAINGCNEGTGIEFSGQRVCDNWIIDQVACRNLQYGFRLSGPSSRECNFSHCIAANCDTGWLIEDADLPTSVHGTNNIRWVMCDALYNRDHAVKIVNRSQQATARVFQWHGGMMHGCCPPDKDHKPSQNPKPLIMLDGLIWAVDFDAHWVGPGGLSLLDIRNNKLKALDIRLSGTWVRHGTNATFQSDGKHIPTLNLREWRG